MKISGPMAALITSLAGPQAGVGIAAFNGVMGVVTRFISNREMVRRINAGEELLRAEDVADKMDEFKALLWEAADQNPLISNAEMREWLGESGEAIPKQINNDDDQVTADDLGL